VGERQTEVSHKKRGPQATQDSFETLLKKDVLQEKKTFWDRNGHEGGGFEDNPEGVCRLGKSSGGHT